MSVAPLQCEQRAASPPRCCASTADMRRFLLDRHTGHARRPSRSADEIGCAIAGSDRTFDGCRQAGPGPVAGQHQIAPGGLRPRGAWRSRAGVAAKVARRSRTICHGGNGLGSPATTATSPQSVRASVSRGTSSRRSAALIVIDSRPGKANSHSIVPLMMPMMGASPAGGSRRKCALTMARNSRRGRQIGYQISRDHRWHRKDHAIVRRRPRSGPRRNRGRRPCPRA